VKNWKRKFFLLGVVIVIFAVMVVLNLFSVPSAVAEEEKPKQDTMQEEKVQEEYELETMTVTAEKRKENIQEVPAAISAFTEITLEDAGIEDVDDIVEFIPNMSFSPSYMPGCFETNFRGIGISQFTEKNPVVIFIDGIAQDHLTNYGTDITNIERVEVLRGSQGTLYGKNAIGGVINIIITTEAAENETYRIKGFVNGPIVKDKLFLGLSGNYYETDGYMKNDHPDGGTFDNKETLGLKSRLRWIPSDRMEVNFHTGMSQKRYGSSSGIIVTAGQQAEYYHAYKNPNDKVESDSFDTALNIGYGGEIFEFISITTYSYSQMDLWQDYCYVNPTMNIVGIRLSDNRAFSQEFRIQSPDKKEGIKWLGGIYYSMDDVKWDDNGMEYDTESMLGYNIYYNWPDDIKEDTTAAFGQMTFPLPGRLAFTAGLRYECVDKEMDYRYEVTRTDTGAVLPYDPFRPGSPTLATYNIKDDWNAFLPKGVLSWTINKDAMIYASVTKGYLAGGFNLCENIKERAKFDEQSSIDYELGAKTSWLDNRLILNANLFYMDIKDMHVYYAPDPFTYITSNAGEAHSQGIEIEAKARPIKGLDITAAFGLGDAEFDEYTNTAGNDCSGKTMTSTPDYTLNLAVQYRHDSGFFSRIGMQGYGQSYFDDVNTIGQEAYEIYNAKIGYEGRNWDVYFYGKNLFDKEYFSFGRTTPLVVGIAGEPQTFGIIASLRF
jgi:iron complex outermembrane receptor protein